MDANYRPFGQLDEPARPPRYPSRLRHFLYGCGIFAAEKDVELAGGKAQSKMARGR